MMGEIKSVKVDNWGVFFLQKLQNFFNKTDYCDLTLQFRDNSQLKVHRLVLSACTDFFNVLEQTCELIDDALIMPAELQADVVVPIVNFMYTGTLEFELKMYGKLLKTAKEMNMTVLLKLLEAHKRTMETAIPLSQNVGRGRGRRPMTTSTPTITKYMSSTMNTQQRIQRRVITTANKTPTPARRLIGGKPMATTTMSNAFRSNPNPLVKTTTVRMQRGPTRFETNNSNIHNDIFETSFDNISYESKPLKDGSEDTDEAGPSSRNPSSPFEQLRKGYNNNKRPSVSMFTSPPAKKPNIEDVKEFSEQQRMRKQIAAEYGDDAEYDGILDDEFHNDDDDDEPMAGVSTSISLVRSQNQHSSTVKQTANDKPTIVVKDNSNTKMDHAKIINEVLRQYPHLVKCNKNIKLKIIPNAGQTQKLAIKKEDDSDVKHEQNPISQAARQQLKELQQKGPCSIRTQTVNKISASTSTRTENIAPQAVSVSAVVHSLPTTTTTTNIAQEKQKINSKTMHALIALGAENITGPWLCLRCGRNGRPICIPSYRGFRRHLINTHKETIDPALCEHCGWRSTSNRMLYHHMLMEHQISSPLYDFPKCEHCTKICVDSEDLNSHIAESHPDTLRQHCIYCNTIFTKEIQLYNHMKIFHKKRARDDGIDFSDDELLEYDEESRQIDCAPEDGKKIKILSDITLPNNVSVMKLSGAKPVVAEESKKPEPKFVSFDGNEIMLTAKQRQEIISQLPEDHEGGVVMVLNEPFETTDETGVVNEEKMDTEEQEEEYVDSQIFHEIERVAMNSSEEAAAEVSVKRETEELNEARESENDEQIDDDHMEWAENLISAHEAQNNEEEIGEEEPDGENEPDIEDDENDLKKTLAKALASEDEDDEHTDSFEKSPTKQEQKMDVAEDEDEEGNVDYVMKTDSGNEDDLHEDDDDGKPDKEDDISLKLKMLTGDWSEDELDDEDSLAEMKKEFDLSTEDDAPNIATEKPDLDIDIKSSENTKNDENLDESEIATQCVQTQDVVQEESSQIQQVKLTEVETGGKKVKEEPEDQQTTTVQDELSVNDLGTTEIEVKEGGSAEVETNVETVIENDTQSATDSNALTTDINDPRTISADKEPTEEKSVITEEESSINKADSKANATNEVQNIDSTKPPTDETSADKLIKEEDDL